MLKKIIYLLLCFNSIAFANSLSEGQHFSPISESRRALQKSSRDINQLSELSRQERLKENNNQENVTPKEVLLPQSDICLPVTGVYLQGITLLKSVDLLAVSALPDDCITTNSLNKLARELTQLYIDKGYITTRIQFVQPNAHGELGLHVVEGFIEKIEGGDQWVNPKFIFPDMTNKPLNLRDLDQGLDQANRLQSNHTTVDILPGNQSGGSIIVLNNQHVSPWFMTTSLDNYGQENTGKWLGRATVSFDSPLGISDFISFNANTTLEPYSERYSKAYTLFYSVPYGTLTLSSFYSYSKYLTKVQLVTNNVVLDGNTQQYGFRGDYLFYRDQDDLLTFSGQLSNKQVNNYFENSLILVSSPQLTVLELSANHSHIFPISILTSDFSLEKGLSILGANSKSNIIDNQFIKFKLSFNYNYSFELFDETYKLSHQLLTQYSPKALPGVEWLSLTERSAVRGFSQSNVSGDNGWYLRNTISRNYFIADALVTPRIAMDGGQVFPHGATQHRTSVIGVSTGATLRYKKVTFDLDISHGQLLLEHQTGHEDVAFLFNSTYQI
ncbi:ShlB/FhaC/HecB family hemolysin secretion/activation protein [uncultured Photobacterium sp.]|uniref:ShlB/FhaC/HecB family hemolysin secretion/activation protein n=1 Tax=uncultured Photobacterium sp. TaxID=173973 RepID=UPI002627DDD1|nr:ShlB/FhaC/HecB family hemolysin secretion/activation protein [uncultured Photobacterium sp.]